MQYVSKPLHKASELVYTLLFFALTWLVIYGLMAWGVAWLYVLGLPVLVVAGILFLAEAWSLTGVEEVTLNASGITSTARCLGWSREVTFSWAEISQLELTPKWTYASDNPAPRRIDRLSRVPFFASYGQLRFRAYDEQVYLGVCLTRAQALEILRLALAEGWIAPWQLSRATEAYIHPVTETAQQPVAATPAPQPEPSTEAATQPVMTPENGMATGHMPATTAELPAETTHPTDSDQLPPISIN